MLLTDHPADIAQHTATDIAIGVGLGEASLVPAGMSLIHTLDTAPQPTPLLVSVMPPADGV